MESFHDSLNRMFSNRRWRSEDACKTWAPAVDILERGDDLIIRAELPGLEKDDIEIRVDNGNLTLSGERKREEESSNGKVFRVERCYGTFSRSFALPTTVDSAKISANYKDGVLEVVLPKAEEAKPKKVEIRAA
jgi:HSP20 family protein